MLLGCGSGVSHGQKGVAWVPQAVTRMSVGGYYGIRVVCWADARWLLWYPRAVYV